MSADVLKLFYYRPFQKDGIVTVVAEDNPAFITFVHEKKTEHISVQFAGQSAAQIEETDLQTAVMETLKCIWLYKNRRSHRFKQEFDDPDQIWAGKHQGSARHAIQSKLDHNMTALSRLNLNKNTIIEDLWASACEIRR